MEKDQDSAGAITLTTFMYLFKYFSLSAVSVTPYALPDVECMKRSGSPGSDTTIPICPIFLILGFVPVNKIKSPGPAFLRSIVLPAFANAAELRGTAI